MVGISAIGGYGYSTVNWYYNRGVSAGMTGGHEATPALNGAGAQSAIQGNRSGGAEILTTNAADGYSKASVFPEQDFMPGQSVPVQSPMFRLGADPAEMAVRGRIQYIGQEEPLGKTPGASDSAAIGTEETKSAKETMEEGECQTCKERKYQDGSDDPGVSFKTPTGVAPERAATAVRSHEMEHVSREQSKAKREGRKVVSQSVTIHTGICPECGKVYVSGGTTRTTTAKDNREEMAQQQQEKIFGKENAA